MEILAFLVEILPSIGFPILCCGALGWFIYKFYTDSQKQNRENMEAVQARCKEREEKLYNQLEKQNEINGRFAEIIAQYEVKLDIIQTDINDIKNVVLSK
jgi:cell division protein YceG involved in septum cleavage